jgi:hypothetical protein
MNSTFHRMSAGAFAFALLASPALAAGMGGGAAADGSVGASTGVVTPDAAGSTGVPGTNSVTGANSNANVGADAMGHSSAELPNNDASTPINSKNPAMKPRPLVPNAEAEGGTNGVAGVNGGNNSSAGAAGSMK